MSFVICKQYRSGKNGKHYASNVHIPIRIARHLPENARYEWEMTDEGVLARFIGFTDEAEVSPPKLPDWCSQNGAAKAE